jgi:hypothetical protein
MNKYSLVPSFLFLVILFLPDMQAQTPTFNRHTIDDDFNGIHRVVLIDFDGDGDLDIVGGSEQTPYTLSEGLVWWRNEGGFPPQWTRFPIDLQYLHIMSVDVAYVDEDNFPDVIASSWSNNTICWWKCDGNLTGTWIRDTVVSGWPNAHDAHGVDINQDGLTDIVGACAGANRIAVFFQDTIGSLHWNQQIVTSSFNHALSSNVADLDDDGNPDIIGAADGSNAIIWWKNDGGMPPVWLSNGIATGFPGSGNTDIVDMNQDQQLDVLGVAYQGDEVAYWICDDIATNSWTKHQITNQLPTASGALGCDMDLDGDMDVVAIGKMPGNLVLFTRMSSGFDETEIQDNLPGAGALAVADLDMDGDTDIIAGSGIDGTLFWFENTIETGTINHPVMPNSLVYPNPASNSIHVEWNQPPVEPWRVQIVDLLGRIVWEMPAWTDQQETILEPVGIQGSFILLVSSQQKILARHQIFLLPNK